MPDQDAVIAITAETANMQTELNLVWDYLLPSIKKENLPEDKSSADLLKQKLSSLALPTAVVGKSSIADRISGKTFTLDANDKHLHSVNFQFNGDVCNVSILGDSVQYNFAFGADKWITGETEMLGPDLLLQAKAHFVGLPPAKVAGSFSWKEDKTLELVLRYVESPHTEKLTCKFDGNKISVGFHYSNIPDYVQPELTGVTKDK
jgi:hypothetical protein